MGEGYAKDVELKRRYGSPSQQSNIRDIQPELQLVKMRKVQEMSNNFSNDINPFHVYDKRWGKGDDATVAMAKFACATQQLAPATPSLCLQQPHASWLLQSVAILAILFLDLALLKWR